MRTVDAEFAVRAKNNFNAQSLLTGSAFAMCTAVLHQISIAVTMLVYVTLRKSRRRSQISPHYPMDSNKTSKLLE